MGLFGVSRWVIYITWQIKNGPCTVPVSEAARRRRHRIAQSRNAVSRKYRISKCPEGARRDRDSWRGTGSPPRGLLQSPKAVPGSSQASVGHLAGRCGAQVKEEGQLVWYSVGPREGCRRAPMPSLAPPAPARRRDEGSSAAQRAKVKRRAGEVQGQPHGAAWKVDRPRARELFVALLQLTSVTGR